MRALLNDLPDQAMADILVDHYFEEVGWVYNVRIARAPTHSLSGGDHVASYFRSCIVQRCWRNVESSGSALTVEFWMVSIQCVHAEIYPEL